MHLQRALESGGPTEDQIALWDPLNDRILKEESAMRAGTRYDDGKPWNSPWPDPQPGSPEANKKLEAVVRQG